MSEDITVGLLDSGIEPSLSDRIAARRRFVDAPPGPDRRAHGNAIARIILHHAPAARLLVADVFGARARTTPEAVADGLDWLRVERARIVNMSFGLREDRTPLRVAIETALAAGLILLAASPARGARVFPAGYPGVIRITGDARCAPGEISALGGRPADFGACPRGLDGEAGGASFATGHVSGLLAAGLAGDVDPATELQRLARFHGPERRLA
jgi:subtilisin family serine protease